MNEPTPNPDKPETVTPATPVVAPDKNLANNKAAIAKIEQFYTPFHGRVGYNPYFYLHSVNFFDLKARVEAGLPLTTEEQTNLGKIVMEEGKAKIGKDQEIDLYRNMQTPTLAAGNPQVNSFGNPTNNPVEGSPVAPRK